MNDFSRYVDEDWLARGAEPVFEPQWVVTDPHHHLWTWPFRYEAEEALADFTSGHQIRATVHLEAHNHYRTTGPEHLRPVGESEYVAHAGDVMTKSAGGPRICAGVVGHVDVTRGAVIEEELEQHMAAAPGRFRGIRVNVYWQMFIDKPWLPSPVSSLLEHPHIRAALGRLAKHEMTCDVVAFHPNLPDVARTAAAFPNTKFIVNHCGAPMFPEGPNDADVPEDWRKGIQLLAQQPNVRIKLGGCLNPMLSRSIPRLAALKTADRAPSSAAIAEAYRPFIDFCVTTLGPARCMFESNFPVEKAFSSYTVLWNAYKRLSAPYSPAERAALLNDTAAQTYRV